MLCLGLMRIEQIDELRNGIKRVSSVIFMPRYAQATLQGALAALNSDQECDARFTSCIPSKFAYVIHDDHVV